MATRVPRLTPETALLAAGLLEVQRGVLAAQELADTGRVGAGFEKGPSVLEVLDAFLTPEFEPHVDRARIRLGKEEPVMSG
jgi:hypothetical protein